VPPSSPTTLIGLVALVGSSSVIAAIITQALGWLLSLHNRRQAEIKEKKFAALYLSITLESYARACAVLIGESELHDSSGGADGRDHDVVLALPDYSAAVDWKALGINMTTRVMDFRVRVESATAWIPSPNDDEDDFAQRVREESASLGVTALTLANELRAKLRQQAVDDGSDRWVSRFLAERTARYAESRLEREAANAGFNEEHFAAPP
jgi:hypothetical protein